MKTLGDLKRLKKHLKLFAILDIIFCDEDWLRFYHFDSNWGKDLSLATIDNGAGDHVYILLSEKGVIIKGFDHESFLSPHARDEYAVYPGIYENTPHALLILLENDAMEKEEVTFCMWREADDTTWKKGDVVIPEGEDDGAEFLLGTIYHDLEDYVEWAKNYYDMPISMEIIQEIFSGIPISEEIIQSLNPERNVDAARKEIKKVL
ncbi:hypothetical protein [Lysinibacillus sp. fls2-241-R2A-57]|uniref:hypothetical protein n=1 Tax=Lysinibacillus sp. fls2-241-R2A-57 TaxID=3040292 RepID=UPI002553F858|nr:hypothetical protein [Lysinibacillus sp. fls2-241-R2A-57]